MKMPEGWKKAFSRAGPNGLEASEYEYWAIDWQKELLLMKEMAEALEHIKDVTTGEFKEEFVLKEINITIGDVLTKFKEWK